MKTKIIMNEDCMICIVFHINMKLKYKGILLSQTVDINLIKNLKIKTLVNKTKKRN